MEKHTDASCPIAPNGLTCQCPRTRVLLDENGEICHTNKICLPAQTGHALHDHFNDETSGTPSDAHHAYE